MKMVFKKGNRPWNKGKHFVHSGSFKKGHNVPDKWKKKISKKNKGNKKWLGKIHKKETKEKISEIRKKLFLGGILKPSETCFKKGNKSWNEGLKLGHLSKKIKNKISEANRGEKNPNWRGGIAKLPYPYEFTKIKKYILKRDNYTCQECGKKGKEVHHIDYNKKNNKPENLITLCKSDHSKTGFKRQDWIKHFQEKICQKN